MPKTLRPRSKPRRKGETPSEAEYSRVKALRKIQQQEREASEKRASQAEVFLQPVKNTTSALEESVKQVPFTGEEYQQAAESQRQDKVQKWHDIETGMEAALTAQLGTDLVGPLLRYGWNALKNKAISPAARTMMNPENFMFEGPKIKPVQMNVPTIEQAMNSSVAPEGGSLIETLFRKPTLRNATAKLDMPAEDAGLYDQTDGDLFGIKLADTALKPRVSVSPHSLPTDFMEHHTGNSVNSVVDNIYNVWNQNYPLWELEGIKPPLPFIASIGDDVMSVGFRPQWYKMIGTPQNLERMTAFAGPSKNKLIANLSQEAKDLQRARDMQTIDLFDEWLGPEARSPQQIATDAELNTFNVNLEHRSIFDSNVNSLYQNGLITPRHRQALLNSDEPLQYFNGGAQHNIMKKATQQYFKDIKAVKQKDYARRLMAARKQEAMINQDLNDTANAAYRDLQGSIQPLTSLNKQITDANRTIGQIRSIGDIVEDTFNNYQAWKADPNPGGWQLKYLMQGNKLERQLSKDGTISVNAINDQVKSGSDIEKYVTEKVLNEKFAGQSKVNYADFKHAVQDELVTYRTQQSHQWENYGMDRIGYNSWEDSEGVNFDTYTFSTPRIPKGSSKHFSDNTLGHSRTFVSNDEPEVMHVLESQSDWGQNKLDVTLSNQQSISNLEDYITRHRRLLEQSRGTQAEANLETDIQIAEKQLDELIAQSKTDIPNAKYLHKNWESRQIQENMVHASDKGLTKMRYPTEETAAKIEGYSKAKRLPYDSTLKQLREDIKQKTSQLNIESEVGINYEGGISGTSYHAALQDPALPDEIKQMIIKYNQLAEEYVYPEQYQTILRKYSEFPKNFKKIYKNQEVREVTDAKGNTWYEVDVPKNMRKRERAYSITGTAIAGGTAAATLKPLKRNK